MKKTKVTLADLQEEHAEELPNREELGLLVGLGLSANLGIFLGGFCNPCHPCH